MNDRQSASRSPRNAGDLDDFVSMETELAAALEKLSAFKVALDKSRAECAELRESVRVRPAAAALAEQRDRADLAERNLAASTARVDELERALSMRRAPDVEEVTDLALRHGLVSARVMMLRRRRGGAASNNDRTPVDEASLLSVRAALQEVIACRMSGTTASNSSEAIVAREMTYMTSIERKADL